MNLSAYMATRNGETRNPPATFASLLRNLVEISDELVVMVDKTTTDNTFEIARQFTKNVYNFTHDPVFLEIRRQSLLRCTGDWVLWVDDDEPLNAQWTRARVEELMGKRTVTHYWVPSRQLVTESGLYISTWPHIGHFNMRMYRNIESITVLPRKTHDSMAIAGEPAYLAGMFSDSMDFIWHTREFRESKVKIYDTSNPHIDNARFYLYEDYYFETRRIDDSQPPAVMEPVEESQGEADVMVRFMDCPEVMTVGQTYWILARVVNNSERPLLPQSEFIRWGTLALSYRWRNASEAADSIGEESIGTPFPARILPAHQHDALMRVKAPPVPGKYALEIGVIEDNKLWLPEDGAARRTVQSIDVRQLVWPPRIQSKEPRKA